MNEKRFARLKQLCSETGNGDYSTDAEWGELALDLTHDMVSEIVRRRAALDFHPRAAKLMNKRKSFIVVADDEPYFHEVYSLIREHEIQKGTWTNEDQRIYEDATNALKGGA